ncbi:MAG: hypothetical protein WAX29_06510 [Propionibacterium sp.]
MPRKVSLPGAEELFRSTTEHSTATHRAVLTVARAAAPRKAGSRDAEAPAQPSGRVRHDEKITIYLSNEELLALEQARLTLRAHHGISVDRGRLVREAVALALGGLEEQGEQAPLVHQLREQDGLG